MLYDERGIVSGEILSRLQNNLMKNERTDDAVYGANAELMHVLRAESLRDSEQKFHVLPVGRIPRVLGLRPIVVDSASQRFHCQQAHAIRRDKSS